MTTTPTAAPLGVTLHATLPMDDLLTALAAKHHVTSAPVVVAMSPVGLVADVWGGHRPDLIRRHLDEYAPSVWEEAAS